MRVLSRRSVFRSAAAIGAAAFVTLSMGLALAAPKAPPVTLPGPASGTIYFAYNGSVTSVAPDGSNIQFLPVGLGQPTYVFDATEVRPSNATHGGRRLWLVVAHVPGMTETFTYPDGTSATINCAELFAVDPISTPPLWIQVTDFGGLNDGDGLYLAPGSAPAVWSNDAVDSFISVWAVVPNKKNDQTLLKISLSGDELLSLAAPLAFPSDKIQSVATRNSFDQKHSWVRDGQSAMISRVALYQDQTTPVGLFRQSVSGGDATFLMTSGRNPACSPTADRMAYDIGLTLTVSDLAGQNTTLSSSQWRQPQWSPLGDQLVVQSVVTTTVKGRTQTTQGLQRVLPTTGTGSVNLTPGLDPNVPRVPLGWRSN